MNESEKAFFFELRKLTPDYYIFPKMRIADFIEVSDGDGYYKNRNKILPKHVDFLICDCDFEPLLVFEVNGSSHNNKRTKESDELKKEVIEGAGIPLWFIEVGSDFSTEIKRILEI